MFPNPQGALPLPASPSIEQYKKLAKELVKACQSGDRDVAAWCDRWMASLLAGSSRRHIDRAAQEVEEFAKRTLHRDGRRCVLADAQFVLARSHGFRNWPDFAAHLAALAQSGTAAADFEAAAEAIIRGDEAKLQELLRKNPGLIRARSTREHNATLLHYVSANGVEGYRQKSPPNAARITKILLDAGADIEAEADVYGGGCTALGLVATSTPPKEAGVQIPVMDVLLEHGAQIEHPDLAGKGADAVYACLANGRREIVQFLLDRGVSVDGHHNDGQTALFYAILGDHVDVVRLLLKHGARSDIMTQNGPVFGAALWRAGHGGNTDKQLEIVEALVAAGGTPPARYPPVNEKIDALLARHGWPADPTRHWPGEEPRR